MFVICLFSKTETETREADIKAETETDSGGSDTKARAILKKQRLTLALPALYLLNLVLWCEEEV